MIDQALRALLVSTLLACNPGLGLAADTPAPFDHSHAAWDALLREHVVGGDLDYAALKADRKAFDAYLARLAAVTPEELSGWSREQRFAFWINAYNAFTVQKVIDHYPLKSIRDLDGALSIRTVFDSEFIPLRRLHPKGKDDDLSLNDIEHAILRERFRDARVHTAINCASRSCPPLRAEAFVAERLDEQLDEQMRAFVADETRNRIEIGAKEIALSEIFKWFSEDFERDGGSVREYVALRAPAEKAATVRAARIRYLDYDWQLNAVRR
jgi:hypothetical protein